MAGTTIAQLQAVISADTRAAQVGIGQLITQLGSGGPLALAAAAGAIAVLGVGIAATKMAGDFQSGITSLVTGAGLSRDSVKMVSDGILQMAVDTGTSTKQLTDGMYMISSAGFPAAQALDILKAAAEGAKVGNADLGDVANGVTTEMKDYASSGITAAQATNILIATVANGKTHMQDLATSMSTILPTSSAVGVSLTDTAAAMATMTGEGTDAASAATYLRQLLLALDAPGSKAQSVFKQIGITAQQVSDGMKKSLPDTLAMITDALAKRFPAGSAQYVAALKDIAGGSRQMQGILELSGTHLDTFGLNVKNITGAVKAGGSSIVGWSDVQGEFNQKIDHAREVVQTLLIKLGTGFLPTVGDIVVKLVDGLIPAVNTVGNVLSFLGQNGDMVKTVLLGLAAGIAVVTVPILIGLVPAFIAWAVAAGAAAVATIVAAAPIIAIIAGITLLIVGLKLAYDHWGFFHAAVDKAREILAFIAPIIGQVIVGDIRTLGAVLGWLGGVAGFVFGHIGDFMGFLGEGIHEDADFIGTTFKVLGALVHDVWSGITTSIRGEVNAIIDLIDGFINAVNRIHIDIPKISLPGGGSIGGGSISFPHIPDIPHLATGGDITKSGWVMTGERGPEPVFLPAGARVLPSGTPSGAAGAPVHVHIHVAGREITSVLMPDFVRAARLASGLRQ